MTNTALNSSREFLSLEAEEQLDIMIRQVFPGRIAVLTSFGTESAVLLNMVARIDAATPVIFLDTGMHFRETLAYKDLLQQRLALTDIRAVGPAVAEVDKFDPHGRLHGRDHDACCALRKVNPLRLALRGFDAWITGRKRYHGEDRAHLPVIEKADGRLKHNPLAGWSEDQINSAFEQRGLPRHPLSFDDYLSLGCRPCTQKNTCGGGIRAGRWAGSNKTECGIHK
jgi:phosphoadenosine phosphosulfate reductase